MMRPSSMDAMSVSPMFQSGESGVDAQRGTDRHKAFRLALDQGDTSLLEMLPDEDQDGVQWSIDYVKCHAPLNDYPLQFDKPCKLTLPDFTEIEGEGDLWCGPDYFDLKFRQRPYPVQMACYALAGFQEHHFNQVTVHVLYLHARRSMRYVLTREDAERLVFPVYERAKAAKKCAISHYCSWCSRIVNCPEYLERIEAIRAGHPNWTLPTYHASGIDDPSTMGAALRMARQVKKWTEAVESFARKMHANGQTPEGFEEKTVQGRQYVNDTTACFGLAGIPQEKFLECCEVRLNPSKSYPDKGALIPAFAKQNQLSGIQAKKEIARRLAPVLSRGNPTVRLLDMKGPEDDES